MSVIEELQTAVGGVAEQVGPSIVGIGRGTRGSGIVIGPGKVITNAHNIRGDEVTVTFADGRSVRGTVAGFDGEGDLAAIDVDTADATPLEWGDGSALCCRGGGLRRRSEPRRRNPSDVRTRVRRRARLPWSRVVGGSRAASSTRRLSRRARPVARSSTRRAGSSASTRTGSARASTSRCRPTTSFASESMRLVAASRRSGCGSASQSRHPTSRAGCADRSGSPSVTACLIRGVEDGSPAAAAGIQAGDLIVEIGGRAVTDPDQLLEALAALEFPFEVQSRPRKRRADRPGRRW